MCFLLLAGWSFAAASRATAGVAEQAFGSRSLPPEPMWQALQGADAATAGDASAIWGNPAGIGGVEAAQVTLGHLSWAGGLAREWGAVALPLSDTWHAAADFGILHTPALDRYDAEGTYLGSMSPSEWTSAFALAARAGRGWTLGAGARLFSLQMPENSLRAVGYMAGLRREGVRWSIGLAATDLGPDVEGEHGSYALPTRYRAGIAWHGLERSFRLSASAEYVRGDELRVAAGIVVSPLARLQLIAGASRGGETDVAAPWSVGAAFDPGPVRVAYAFRAAGALEGTHQVGLSWTTGRRDMPQRAEARYAVWGGRFARPEDAAAELAVIRSHGFPRASLVQEEDGRTRILIGVYPSAGEADDRREELRRCATPSVVELLP